MIAPPLSLYIHIPWCVQKCPYCDFNSHSLKQTIPEEEYIQHLLADLQDDAKRIGNRPIQSIFIGGGTPSLLSAEAMAKLLKGVRQRVTLTGDVEITMEANPGTAESKKFQGFEQAGINRISIGVQSFQQHQLKALGRIHDGKQALAAAQFARDANLPNFNLDLMHGLPKQTCDDALLDLSHAVDQKPTHLSWYQLTIEPNTQFFSKPPKLPDDDILWDIQEKGQAYLTAQGYVQYEISAYSLPGYQSRHNLNYWRFGDYLGIGCGAHGKLTDIKTGVISRSEKVKHPRGYMDISKSYTYKHWQVQKEDLPFEFFMNRLRLLEPCPKADYEKLTGDSLPREVQEALNKAALTGLIDESTDTWQLTETGKRYLNTLLEMLV